MKRKLSLSLVLSAVLLLTQTACPEKDKSLAFARDLLSASTRVQVLIAADHPELAARWTKVVSSAQQIVTALQTSQSANIPALVRDILPTVNTVIAAYGNNRRFLLAFAVGEIALDFFINHYTPAPQVAAAPADTEVVAGMPQRAIAEFQSRRRITCRNSQTGRFEKIDFCRAHPDVSTLERR